MHAWRIAKRVHALDHFGVGARLNGGRWNSAGIEAIYAGLTPEIAALEKLVHTGKTLPTDLVLVLLNLPDAANLYLHATVRDLPTGWGALPSSTVAILCGDKFLSEHTYLGMIVPSAVMPEARNIVLNPRHSAFAQVQMTVLRSFEFDSRLLT